MLLFLAVHVELPDASYAELLLLELNLGTMREFRSKRTDTSGKVAEEKDLGSGKHAMGE
jgi:hypothetical protein